MWGSSKRGFDNKLCVCEFQVQFHKFIFIFSNNRLHRKGLWKAAIQKINRVWPKWKISSYSSTISSVLNAGSAQLWEDLVKPYWKVSDRIATLITKIFGKYRFISGTRQIKMGPVTPDTICHQYVDSWGFQEIRLSCEGGLRDRFYYSQGWCGSPSGVPFTVEASVESQWVQDPPVVENVPI